MITRIKGKNITNFYSVKDNKKMQAVNNDELKSVYTAKPELVKEPKVEWEEICNFEGDLHYSDSLYFFPLQKYIHLSEDEEVRIEKIKFRADLNEQHAFTGKIIDEQDDEKSKSDAEAIFKEEVANFNEAMIESNDAMLAYCKLHKLDPRDTDCFELFKLVYPGETYQIVNGAMKKYDYSSILAIKADYMDYGSVLTISETISALESKVTCVNGSTITVEA